MSKNFREPVSGFTHLFGALVSLVGLIALIYKEIYIGQNSILGMIGVVIFGLSLIFLYTASTVYHLAVSSEGVIKMLRKLDHSMIFVLIAGTYTPICLIALESYWRWGLFICVWLLALIGIVFKFFWIDCPKWLSSSFYVGLGWLALVAFSPLSKVLPFQAMALLILGGILYTAGAVIYCLEKKGKKRTFGAHEIFHIFVLLGSLAHYILVFKYII